MKIELASRAPEQETSDVVIIGHYRDQALPEQLVAAAELNDFHGKLASVMVADGVMQAKRCLVVGLGRKEELTDLDKVRKATAAAIRKASSLKARTVSLGLYAQDAGFDRAKLTRTVCEVALLAAYKYDKYRSQSEEEDKAEGIEELHVLSNDLTDDLHDQVRRARLAATGVLKARELVAEPANVATPEYLANTAEQMASENLEVRILGREQCQELGMGAYLGVAQGADSEPKFIHMTYHPPGEPAGHIALVGKGITFDSGGLSLKPAKAMEKMKYDMAGSASVLGVMSSIVELAPKVRVTAIVAACENMPSGNAIRPGDILWARNGKSIEITNTDAEGRLTLADAVYYACEQGAEHVIDLATLTGAVVVALGETAAGLMTNDEDTYTPRLQAAFADSGEKVWQLPLYEDYEEDVKKSYIADYINAASGGQAGSQNGGLFVKQFLTEGTKWTHLDIAGACWPERRDTFFTPKNSPSGFGVLSLIRYLESF